MSKRRSLGLIRNPFTSVPSFHPVYADDTPKCVECEKPIGAGKTGRSCVDCRRLAEPVDVTWLESLGGVFRPENGYLFDDLLVCRSGDSWVTLPSGKDFVDAIPTPLKGDVLNMLLLQQTLRKANEQHEDLQAEPAEPGLQVDEEPAGASACKA